MDSRKEQLGLESDGYVIIVGRERNIVLVLTKIIGGEQKEPKQPHAVNKNMVVSGGRGGFKAEKIENYGFFWGSLEV
ncbi:conserved hypothetical protein [Ricinus communis]|uniref:Uncharacterized protein n=1 Tax=Ricinus communis TaxID=3988 RepID=B9T0X6_RICCO|nr:conserved hypothetical protein [Ricinus communis]